MPRSLSHHLWQLPIYHIDNKRDLRVLSLIRLVRDIADKSTLFFLPLFLFGVGKTVMLPAIFGQPGEFQRGMAIMASWYGGMRLVILCTAVLSARILSQFGYRAIFGLSGAGLSASMVCFYLAIGNPLWLLPALFFYGIQIVSFWHGYELLLSQVALRSHLGQDMGTMQFLFELGGLFAPAFGGLISVTLGFQALFFSGLFWAIACTVSALFVEHEAPAGVSWTQIKQELVHPHFPHHMISNIGRYWQDALLVIWPIYVFLIVGKIDRVGYLYSIALFGALLATFFGGIYIDHAKNKHSFILSAAALSGLWLGRLGVSGAWGIALVDGLTKIIANFHWLFFDTLQLRSGQASNSLAFFTARELVISLAAIVFWTGLAGFFLATAVAWQTLFEIGAVCVLITALASDRKVL